jgi:hypothetical protein
VIYLPFGAGADGGATVDIEWFADNAGPGSLLSIHHVHLPKPEAGFVRIYREPNRVRRGPNFDDVEPPLRAIGDGADELPADRP